MTRLYTSPLGLATLAALGLAAAQLSGAPAARAQSLTLNSGDAITVSGQGTAGHIGATTYTPPNAMTTITATNGDYAVQTNGTSTFTLAAGGNLTATGGDALDAMGSGPVTIEGGTLTANGQASDALDSLSGPVTVTGGIFSGGIDLATNGSGSIDVYGSFKGFALGHVVTVPGGDGSFIGTLENATAAQTFTYRDFGAITLHDVGLAATPEPSAFVGLGIGLLGLGAVGMRARRRGMNAV